MAQPRTTTTQQWVAAQLATRPPLTDNQRRRVRQVFLRARRAESARVAS